jgi:serine/threonine-protein kinase HipA
MKLAPGTPLAVGLLEDEAQAPAPVARLAMAQRRAQLEWASEAIAQGHALSPLLYPLGPGLQEARSTEFSGLHGFLADSLPDSWGELVLRRRAEKAGVRWAELTPVDRLAVVGNMGRGALVFTPATAPQDADGSIDLDALARETTSILKGEESDLEALLARLGGGSGGARPKINVGFNEAGDILPEAINPGDEAWIVKFKTLGDPLDIGPVEQAYATMARAAGLDVPPSKVIEAKDGPGYFAVKRFDRRGPGRRIHMVSLSGAIETPWEMPSIDYDGFLRATHAITRHADDVKAAFRRMVFNILACNRDDHARQHSYLMDGSGNWRLAPAYDLTYSTGPGGEHYMAVDGDGRAPNRNNARAVGRRAGLSDTAMDTIISQVRESVADWPTYASATGVSVSRAEIDARLQETVGTFK